MRTRTTAKKSYGKSQLHTVTVDYYKAEFDYQLAVLSIVLVFYACPSTLFILVISFFIGSEIEPV